MDVVVILRNSKVDDERSLRLPRAGVRRPKWTENKLDQTFIVRTPGFPLETIFFLGLAGPGVGSPERQFLHYLVEAVKYCLVSGQEGCGITEVRDPITISQPPAYPGISDIEQRSL